MNRHSSLDRESFQQLLASAFAVQESQIDPRLLSAVVNIQRLIAEGELDAEKLMPMVVDSARSVADASGVAIGLIERDQLTYRAGSGCSAGNVGRQVTASLTGTGDVTARREILRVENSDEDPRIEAAICRQFGAKSLLILPIYKRRQLAGVLEIQFAEPHPFPDLEVRTYRLMAGLIDQALEHAQPEVQQNPVAAQAAAPVVANSISPVSSQPLSREDEITRQAQVLSTFVAISNRTDDRFQRWAAALAPLRESASRQAALLAARTGALATTTGALATGLVQRTKESSWYKNPPKPSLAALRESRVFKRTAALATHLVQRSKELARNNRIPKAAIPRPSLTRPSIPQLRIPQLSIPQLTFSRKLAMGGIAAVLSLTCLIAFAHKGRGPESSMKPAPPVATDADSSAPAQDAQPAPEKVAFTTPATTSPAVTAVPSPALAKPSPVSVRRQEVAHAKSSAAGRRVRVGDNEVDYVRGDVTVRYFTKKPAPQRKQTRETARVAHIGRDVTVRYFGTEPLQKSASR